MPLPHILLSGDALARGLAQGQTLASRIAHNRELYFERFAREALLPYEAVLSLARRWADALEVAHPDYAAAMQGLARGAQLPYEEIVALNVRYEILYYRFGRLAEERASDGCTAFALLPEATKEGRLLLGQNWDWIPGIKGAVLHTVHEDGFETLAYTEAGVVGGKIGINSAGVGLAVNGLTSTGDLRDRFTAPFHVRCEQILRSRTFADALAVVTDEPRACSANFLIAQAPDRAASVEAAPDAVNVVRPEGGVLTHANHFVASEAMGIAEPPNPRRPYSCRRQERLRALLLASRPATRSAVASALRDCEDERRGICRHGDPDQPPEQRYITVIGAILDPERGEIHLTDGPPDENPYETFALRTTASMA